MSSVTLYRKYRPQSFDEIVNQDHVKTTIRHEISTGQMPHAFLFHGPRGVGKTTMARVIAKALNCKKRKEKEPDPCGECEACVSIQEGAFLNLVEVDAASQTGVDNVRENIIANARVAVNGNEFKIFIIDEVHMLSTNSFNALLKTLEEPPQRVVFILATTEIHKIPATILSRCQRFDFHPVDAQLLKEHLALLAKKEKRNVADEVLLSIVKKSSGHVRDAISLLGQVLSLEGEITPEKAALILPMSNAEQIISFFEATTNGEITQALQQLAELETKGFRPRQFCQDLIEFGHKLLLVSTQSDPDAFAGEVGAHQLEQIQQIVSRLRPADLLKILDILMKRHLQLKDYDHGKIPLELAAVEISTVLSEPSAKPASPSPAPLPSAHQPAPRPASPQQPVKPAAKQPAAAPEKTESKPVQEKKTSPIEEQPQVEMKDAALYEEVEAIWPAFLREMADHFHSVFIVLRTAMLRKGEQGEPEIAFRFQMHHDHVLRHRSSLNEVAQKLLSKQVYFRLAVDADLIQTNDEVTELKEEEKEELGQELSELAAAFGGSVMD